MTELTHENRHQAVDEAAQAAHGGRTAALVKLRRGEEAGALAEAVAAYGRGAVDDILDQLSEIEYDQADAGRRAELDGMLVTRGPGELPAHWRAAAAELRPGDEALAVALRMCAGDLAAALAIYPAEVPGPG